MNENLLLVGRGASLEGTQIPSGCDIGAISSGIFTLPPGVAKHWFSIDPPKYFGDVRLPYPGAWPQDPQCEWWDALGAKDLQKHVPSDRNRGGYWRFEGDMLKQHDSMEWDELLIAMGKLSDRPDLIGYQPGWGDYRNVHGWPYNRRCQASYLKHGPFGADGEPINKTPVFAVQVAHRLGYKRILFAGVDLADNEPMTRCVEFMKVLAERSAAAGCEWFNVSPGSPFGEWLPAYGSVEVAA